jgi:hypothetical protein
VNDRVVWEVLVAVVFVEKLDRMQIKAGEVYTRWE